MRIRGTKPEFWHSERIASVDWDARLVLKGLESYVDDNGVGKDDLALIVSDVFPRDLVREPSRTLARVSEAISALELAGLVHRYEVDGAKLLFVAFWESVQRVDKPAKGRFRRPDGTWNYGDSSIRESVASPREDSKTPRACNRGTGEQGNSKKDSSSEAADAAARPDVEQLCNHLADRIEANGSKRPSIGKGWHDSCRRMLDLDGRTADQIRSAIDWCQSDEFWRGNVLSMPKLREKYDQLRLAAIRDRDKNADNAPRSSGAWVPPEPPDEITNDPDPNAFSRWYREQVEAHERRAS